MKKINANRKMGLLLVLLIATTLVTAGCTPAATTETAAPEMITIAVTGPLSGDYAQYGEAFRNATELKANQLNESGGINGQQVQLRFFDDQNDSREAANIAQRLVDDQSIAAVIGPFSSTAALAGAPIYQRGELVQLSPTASHPDFTAQGSYMFRNINTQATEGPIVADLLVNTLEARQVAIIYINNDWGLTTKENVSNAIRDLGGEVVAEESYMDGQSRDFNATLTRLAGINPDVIFVAGFYAETGAIAQQMQQLGIDIPLVGPSSLFNEALIDLAGEAVEGLVVTSNFFPNEADERISAFVDAYQEAYGSTPNQFAAVAYDSLGMLAQAIEDAGSTNREAVRNALAQLENYPGVTGLTSFDENRDVIKNMTVLEIRDGEFRVRD